MSRDAKDRFDQIVGHNWDVLVDDNYSDSVMPARFVVEDGVQAYQIGRELVRYVMMHCGPLEPGEVFNMDDVTAANEYGELGN